MTTITQYFEQAQLSLAAYALNLQQGMSASFQRDLYTKALTDAGMSATQAAAFASTYTVVDQYTNALSGFSATVFKNNATGEYNFAIRGTETPGSGGIFELKGSASHYFLNNHAASPTH